MDLPYENIYILMIVIVKKEVYLYTLKLNNYFSIILWNTTRNNIFYFIFLSFFFLSNNLFLSFYLLGCFPFFRNLLNLCKHRILLNIVSLIAAHFAILHCRTVVETFNIFLWGVSIF